jgi:tRNA (adenine22-N1)-methyltransferase
MDKGSKKQVILSARLTALADLVTPGSRVCDVGCDHGLLSIYLVQRHISPRVIAMDVRKGPLESAAKHVTLYGMSDYIETRLSDGLTAFRQGEAQTVVCAGMGGRLMERILREGGEKVKTFRELILQPQSEIPQFRRFLHTEGYRILHENMIEENGKFYFLLKAIWTGKPVFCEEPLFDRFGESSLRSRSPVLLRYLRDKKQKAEFALEQLRLSTEADRRQEELIQELSLIQQAISWYDEMPSDAEMPGNAETEKESNFRTGRIK